MNGNGEDVLLLGAVLLRLVDNLDHTPGHLGHLAFNRGPPVVLELRHLDGVLRLAVGHRELPLRVVRATFALDVRHEQIFVLHLLVGPVPGALVRTVADLRKHDDRLYPLLEDHPPKVEDGVLHRVLRDDEVVLIVVPVDEGRVDVGAVVMAGDGRQNDPVLVVRHARLGPILRLVVLAAADGRRLAAVLLEGLYSLELRFQLTYFGVLRRWLFETFYGGS